MTLLEFALEDIGTTTMATFLTQIGSEHTRKATREEAITLIARGIISTRLGNRYTQKYGACLIDAPSLAAQVYDALPEK